MTAFTKFFALFLLAVVAISHIEAKATNKPLKAPKTAPTKEDVPSSSFWKAKYGDYEMIQEGFPFNFIMPAV